MENNNIIKESPLSDTESLYQEYIIETIEFLKKYTDIKLFSKILHYLEKPTFYYYCTVTEDTKTNPFKKDIEFRFEFIDGEIPYVTILTEFTDHIMNDNRNYYRCLTKEHNYIFHLDDFKLHKQILESMIQGIGNFLNVIKESLAINTFVYFGEYEFNHIYQINDFLQNKSYLNFYRINEIIKDKQKEKYIFFTQLYFLLFEPLKEDKALIKLELCEILKDINLSFDKNEIKDSLIFKMSSPRLKEETFEFFLINRKRKTKEKKEIKEIKEIKEDNNKEKKDSNNNIINNEDSKNINENKNKIKEKKVNNMNQIKEDERKNYSILIKEWFTYLDMNDFKKYDLILEDYRMIFSGFRGNLDIKEGENDKIDKYNKYIEFYEKIVSYYENKNDKNNNNRIHQLIGELIYLCSELVNYAQNKKWENNEYLLKVKKYINSYKK